MFEEQGKKHVDLGDLSPKQFQGWSMEGDDRLFDPETIFDYIDGAGEVYRAYGFRSLRARHFVKPDNPRIIADLFDMGSAADAFGVFTHNLEGQRVGIGRDSRYSGGLLSFWQDRFYVSLFAETETPFTKAALMELGAHISSAIPTVGEPPAIVSALPPQGLDRDGIRYMRSHLILNYHYFVAEENILGIDPDTEAVLGTYGKGEARFLLLMIRYPRPEEATCALAVFMREYMPDAAGKGVVRTENGRWTGASVKAERLAVVFDAPSPDVVRMMLAKALS